MVKLKTIQELVESLAALGERPAVGLRQEFGVRWWSYARLSAEACGVADLLRRLRLPPGSRLLLWAPNCPEWVAFLLGAALRGVVVVPADASASPQAVLRLAHQVDARLVVHGQDQDAATFPHPRQPLYRTQPLPPGLSAQALKVPLEAGDPALILFTSGTTQEPRGVPLTHTNLMVQVEPFRRFRYPLRLMRVRMLVLSPLSHVQGLLLGVCLPLSLGLSVLYSVSVAPAHVARTLRQNRITVLVAVPRLQHLLAEYLQQTPSGKPGVRLGERMRSLRPFLLRRHHLFLGTHALLGYWFWILVVGGASLPEADERFWHESGYVLVQGYGLTETAALVSLNVDNPLRRRIGSIGRPLPHQTVWLAPDGEILVQGPNLSPAAAACPDPTREGVPGAPAGYLATGDLGRWDRFGRLHFVGRKKEVIVTGEGHNVYPQEVEAVLNELPGVREAVVIGQERSGHAEVHAVLWLEAGRGAAELVQQANARLEPHQRISGWSVWEGEDLPRTSLLKARRREVAAALERPARPVGGSGAVRPSLEQIREMGDRRERLDGLVRYLLEAPSGPPEAGRQRLVQDLGLSSLDLVELVTSLEDRLKAPVNDSVIYAGVTLGDLKSAIQEQKFTRTPNRLPQLEPGWSRTVVGSFLRSLVQPVVIGLWAALCVKPVGVFPEDGMRVEKPIVITAAPHRHWLDPFAIYAALPDKLRKEMLIVTNRDFRTFFAPPPGTRLYKRLLLGFAYYALIPLVFRFTILPRYGTTRVGLYETGRLIERGYTPLMFPKGFFFYPEDALRHDRGAVMLALQTQALILPVWIEGNDSSSFRDPRPKRKQNRPKILVHFGEPIRTSTNQSIANLVDELEAAFQQLSQVS